MEIFKIKNNSNRFYILPQPSEKEGFVLLNELFLGGNMTEEKFAFDKDDIELVTNPTAPWKAAFLVCKNSQILKEIEKEESQKNESYKIKTIKLLADKYGIDREVLLKIIKELEECQD